jgi:hypothetical protein
MAMEVATEGVSTCATAALASSRTVGKMVASTIVILEDG